MDESYLEWLRVLPGLSAEKARKVAARFPTFEHLRAATREELASVEGLTPPEIEALHHKLHDPAARDDEGHLFLCPECGSFAGPKARECPFCGVAFGEDESVADLDDIAAFLREEDAPTRMCQACGAAMAKDATRCEICGRTYTTQQAGRLPGLGSPLDLATRFCAHCGAYLDSDSFECVICGFDRLKAPAAPAHGHNGKGLAEGFLNRWQRVAEAVPATEADRLKEELEHYEKLVEVDPALERAWAKRGRLLAKMGRAADAAESLAKAAELDPSRDEEYRLEVLDLLRSPEDRSFLPPRWRQPRATAAPAAVDARLVEALHHYDALLEEDPELVVAWRTKGEILERLSRTEEAGPCFERAEALERHADAVLRASVSGLRARGLASSLSPAAGRTNGLAHGHVNGRTNGKTNGRVNGLAAGRVNGLTNGAVNGVGLTRGATNGLGGFTSGRTNGLVNGNGFTNGRRGRYSASRIPSQPHWARSLVGIAAVVALMVLVPVLASIFSPAPGTYAPIAIDHNFGEWNRFVAYVNAPPANLINPDINLLEVKVTTDPSNLYVYAKVQGLLFQAPWTNGTESILVFVDTDHNPSTGYPIGDLGADLMTVVTGWDGQIQNTGLYAFNESGLARSSDYRRFLPAGTVSAAFLGNQLEMQILLVSDPAQARVLVYGADNQGNRNSMVGIIQPSRPTTVVSQRTVAPAIAPASSVPFLRITLSAMGGVPTVGALAFEREGSSQDPANVALYLDDGSGIFNVNDTRLSSAALGGSSTRVPVNLSLSRPLTLWAVVSWANVSPMTTFGLQVSGAVGNGTSSLTPPDTGLVYLGAAPLTPTVDGAFGDWAGRPYGVDPVGDVVNRTGAYVYDANVDLLATALDHGANFTGFAQVDGRMLGGEEIPNDVLRPSPNPPNQGNISNVTPPYAPQVGYDVLYGYIDADNSTLTGLPVSAEGRNYGFDYAIVITGRNGTIVASALYAHAPAANSSWRYMRSVRAAQDAHRIEFGVNASAMNLTAAYRVVFYATDWRLQYDVALPDVAVKTFTLGSLAIATNVVINEISVTSNPQWIEVANPASQAVNISGWTLRVGGVNNGNVIYTFGSVILGPFGSGSYLLAVDLPRNSLPTRRTTVSLMNGPTVVDTTTYPGNPSAGTTWARYKDPQTGQPMSSYQGGSPWYTSSAPTKGRPNDRTAPAFTLSKSVSSQTSTPGSFLTYTLTYRNTGNAVARTVWINDTLPAGVTYVSASAPYASLSGSTYGWVFPAVTVGSHSFTIRVQVNGVGTDRSLQANSASLMFTDQLGQPLGGQRAWANFTMRRPMITIAKVVTPTSAAPGQTVTFTIYYNNTGSRNAGTVSISDVLPTGLTFGGSTPTPTAVSGRTYYWNFTNVAPGAHRIVLTATVSPSASGSQLVNWAFLNYTANRYSLPGSKASAIVAIPELSDFLFVAAVPFLVIGLRMRARRSKEAEQKKE